MNRKNAMVFLQLKTKLVINLSFIFQIPTHILCINSRCTVIFFSEIQNKFFRYYAHVYRSLLEKELLRTKSKYCHVYTWIVIIVVFITKQ